MTVILRVFIPHGRVFYQSFRECAAFTFRVTECDSGEYSEVGALRLPGMSEHSFTTQSEISK